MVLVQLSLAYEPDLDNESGHNRFFKPIRGEFSALRREPIFQPKFSPNDGIGSALDTQLRGTNDAATATVSISARLLEIAVSGRKYEGFEKSVLPRVQEAVASLLHAAENVRIEEIVLRYLNEIEMPSANSGPAEWRLWIRPEVIEASALGARSGTCPSFRMMAHNHHPSDSELNLIVQCGIHFGSSIIATELPIAPKGLSETRQAIVIDVQAQWHPELPESMTVDEIVSKLNDLHELTLGPFEWLITDKARSKFDNGDDNDAND